MLKSGEDGTKTLVIFIDDLDRCLPEAALRLLEGIKIYLNLNNCIVVFGMDHRQLEQSLQKALPGAETGQTSYYAREYLEKICQDIHYLPVPSQKEKSDYFLELLQTIDCGDHDKKNVHCKILEKLLNKHDCLPANPRKIKILVNRTALVLRAYPLPGTQQDNLRWHTLLLVVVIIYVFHKPVYEQLDKNPAYISEVCSCSENFFGTKNDERMRPMQEFVPSEDKSRNALPVNPSDSNVWRLHRLLASLNPVTRKELEPFLRLS